MYGIFLPEIWRAAKCLLLHGLLMSGTSRNTHKKGKNDVCVFNPE